MYKLMANSLFGKLCQNTYAKSKLVDFNGPALIIMRDRFKSLINGNDYLRNIPGDGGFKGPIEPVYQKENDDDEKYTAYVRNNCVDTDDGVAPFKIKESSIHSEGRYKTVKAPTCYRF